VRPHTSADVTTPVAQSV